MIVSDIQTHFPGLIYSNEDMITHLQFSEETLSDALETVGGKRFEEIRSSPSFFPNLGVQYRHVLCDVADPMHWWEEWAGKDPFALEAAKAYENLMQNHEPLTENDRLIVIGNGVDTVSPHIGYATIGHLQDRTEGFVAPSVISLVGEGCSGFISGLREADIYMRACPGTRVVVLTVEMMATPLLNPWLLPGLVDNIKEDPEASRRRLTGLGIQRYLFGDGCAAAMCSMDEPDSGSFFRFESFHKWANLDPEDRHLLELVGINTKALPQLPPFGFFNQDPKRLFSRLVSTYLPAAYGELSKRAEMPAHFAIHTGSGKILDFIQQGFGLSDEQMEPSRFILRNCGNMNATTGAAVLEHLMNNEGTTEDVAAMFFGVGFALQLAM